MPTISDYLLKAAGGAQPNVWVSLLSNKSAKRYVATALTGLDGLFTIPNTPAGLYTVATGPSAIGPWVTTADVNYPVAPANFGFFNVLDYAGVDPTGATDSTTGIRAAIADAVLAGGGVVYLPSGTYLITGSLTLQSNVWLQGAGRGLTIITLGAVDVPMITTTKVGTSQSVYTNIAITDLTLKSGFGHLLQLNNVDRVYISDVEGTHTAFNGIREGIFLQHCQHITVGLCFIHDYNGDGIQLNHCSMFTVIGNLVDGGAHADDGIDIDSDFLDTTSLMSQYGVVSGNTVRNHPIGCGIRVEDSQYVSVVGNTIDTMTVGTGQGAGISVNGATATIVTQWIAVVGNVVNNCVDPGIAVAPYAPNTCKHISVVGNILNNCGQVGGTDIRAGIQLSATDMICTDNYLSGCGGSDSNGGAIVVYKGDRALIAHNVIQGGTFGIRLWNGDTLQTYTDVQLELNRFVGITLANQYVDAIGQAGVSKLHFDTSGNLGVGTVAPGSTLDVVGSIRMLAGGSLDVRAAGALNLGPTNATSITIGKTGVTTAIGGPLTVPAGGSLDTAAAGSFNLGPVNATSIQILGSSGVLIDATNGLQARGVSTETPQASANVRMGIVGGNPRLILDNTSTIWEIDNNGTTLRFNTAGTVRGGLDTTGNMMVPAGGNFDVLTAGALTVGKTGATSVGIAKAGVTTAIGGPLTVPAGGSLDAAAAGALLVGTVTATSVQVGPNGLKVDAAGHLISLSSGTPASSALGANVTSVTPSGNDVRGELTIVMAGALAANTKIATLTFATSYGATPPKIILVDQTSAVGVGLVNFYVQAQSTGVSFDLASDQALAAGTYKVDYVVIG